MHRPAEPKSHYRVAVIGGGIVGVNVLYHLTRRGWQDVALFERADLTAGSTWHAAAGFHAINNDPTLSALQAYTIGLYPQVEAESGQSVGLHMPGGYSLATTPERWEWLQAEHALHRTLGIDSRLATPDQIIADCPIVAPHGLLGGLFDPLEGRVDPHGATHAFAIAARRRGAEVFQHTRVLAIERTGDGYWRIHTERGTSVVEHVVNAAGLWARRVAAMVGVKLPLIPMQHHYLVTEDLPQLRERPTEMPCVTDLEGFTYLQQDRHGVLLGVYERNPRHWIADGPDWDFGMQLLPEDLERIAPELTLGFERFPALATVGIRRWVNGAFTFTPDGNPLVGPMGGLRNAWAACGCMGGFSQGGAIGRVLADWIVDGDPGRDVFGMDIARFGTFATNDQYLRATTAQFYARRFVMAYPNEELPAGRPLHTTAVYDLQRAAGARFGVVWGTESPQYFARDAGFQEAPTLRRSNAEPLVRAEVAATRAAAGLLDTSVYARYEVTGTGAAEWLDRLLAGRLPAPGQMRLAPMLGHDGRLRGDLSVTCLEPQRYWLIGSYQLQDWHGRWFDEHLPAQGVHWRNLSAHWHGFSLSGPASRAILQRLCQADLSGTALPLFGCRQLDVGPTQALLARVSLTGELGYEITVPAMQLRALWEAVHEAGEPHGLRDIGMRAQDSLRLEKGYGIWSFEYTADVTPAMCGLDRFIDFSKTDFIGRDAALRARAQPGQRRLVLLRVDHEDAPARGREPVLSDGQVVGHVTSGGWGLHVDMNLALAYVERHALERAAALSVPVIGQPVPARVLTQAPYDPTGARLRG